MQIVIKIHVNIEKKCQLIFIKIKTLRQWLEQQMIL